MNRSLACSIAPVLVVLALACGRDPTAPVAPVPESEAFAPAYHVYVTNETSGDLTVIAGGTHTVVQTVPLGKRPRGIKASPDGTRLFVALSGSPPAPPGIDESTLPPPDRSADGIGIIHVEHLAVIRILRGGTDPEQVALNADATRVYVANEDASTASILDIESGEVLTTLPVGGEPEGMTTSPDGRFVYVTSETDNQVSVIDTSSNEVIEQFEVGPRPRSSAFSPDSSRAYVTSENGGTVSIVDTSSHTVIATFEVPGEPSRPMGVVVSPNGEIIYISTGRGRTIVAMDAVEGVVRGTATVGDRPWGIALSPDGRYLYTANGPSNDVSIVDTQTMTVEATVSVGERPWGVAIIPN